MPAVRALLHGLSPRKTLGGMLLTRSPLAAHAPCAAFDTLLWKARVAQSVELQTCASEGGPLGDDGWLVAEVFQQDNVEQGTRGEYLVLTAYSRDGAAAVRARQRVAAFLQPTDGQYFDALGKPVALYDYSYRYTRP
jgi:hypothetical protein